MVMSVAIKTVIKKSCPRFVLNFYYSMRSYLDRKYRGIKYSTLIKSTHAHYICVEKKIKERGDNHLKFASYVVYGSTFGAHKLMDLMLADVEHYTPRVVICPDISRGQNHLKEQYRNTKDFFIKKYGKDFVIDGYDIETGEFIDVSDQFDIVYLANPYDSMVNEVHGVKFLSKKDILPIYISYGYYISRWHYTYVERELELSLFYKYFVDTTYSLKEIKRYSISGGQNTVLSGYAKMDDLIISNSSNEKIKILISPHHTIKGCNEHLELSNFTTYYDFILKLPEIYKGIEFVFRPHPLLFRNLLNMGIWSQDMVDEYIRKLEDVGFIYSQEPDYFHLFNECDAIIHDCGSYMVEWLYTGKPCCYVVENERKLRKQLSLLGNKAMDYHFLAHNERELLSFIDNVISGKSLCNYNSKVKSNVMINYPNVSEFILNNLLLGT